MNAFRQLLKRAPPEILYHYTTQKGLLGITGEGNIWASASRYLNDSSEFDVGIELARRCIESKMKEESDHDRRHWLDEMRAGLNDLQMKVCVCSFSEKGDSLSQWRAYSGFQTGYALGFDVMRLVDLANDGDYVLAPCIYESADQVPVMESLIQEVLDWAEDERDGTRCAKVREWDSTPCDHFQYLMNSYALVFKHKSFSEEAEWRLISKPMAYSVMDFREGVSTIVPFHKFSLTKRGRPLPLRRIFVGPCPHPQDAISALKGLLEARLPGNSETPDVVSSGIPFRNW